MFLWYTECPGYSSVGFTHQYKKKLLIVLLFHFELSEASQTGSFSRYDSYVVVLCDYKGITYIPPSGTKLVFGA